MNLFLTRKSLEKIVALVSDAVEKNCLEKTGRFGKGVCGTACQILKQQLELKGVSSKELGIVHANFDHWVLKVATPFSEFVVDPTVGQFFPKGYDVPKIFVGTKREYLDLHRDKNSTFSMSFIYKSMISVKRGLSTPYQDWHRHL